MSEKVQFGEPVHQVWILTVNRFRELAQLVRLNLVSRTELRDSAGCWEPTGCREPIGPYDSTVQMNHATRYVRTVDFTSRSFIPSTGYQYEKNNARHVLDFPTLYSTLYNFFFPDKQ